MNHIVTYEERLAKIKKPGDEDKQLQRANNYARNLERRLAQATAENNPMALKYLHAEARVVLRKLRQNIFHLQDMLEKTAENSCSNPE